eukprot:CAMPEP_0196994566 /NCGR_PEP_ID=MMETSP1380-20130617/851_1 /TAXON_ID=5936 /ORGANISM="Euplotes crassus, Strain CT5" /LENGTH=185 /DNA_ID=CAMNT_0042409981 /DNA_START=6 /DNA_END=563 /DNA_ORIENTATION=+
MSDSAPSFWDTDGVTHEPEYLQMSSVFDENMFRREDDLLNVFRSTSHNESLYADHKVAEEEPTSCLAYSHTHMPLFDYCNKEDGDLKSSMNLFKIESNREGVLSSETSVPVKPLQSKDVFKTTPQVSITEKTLQNSGNDNSPPDNTFADSSKMGDDSEEIKLHNNKGEKLFSKRKDVIIKALLRK